LKATQTKKQEEGHGRPEKDSTHEENLVLNFHIGMVT
jgi:hypothetical protein